MKYLNTVESVREIEVQHQRCSGKYVPMKTTEFISSLKGFDFVQGAMFRNNSSAHWVQLTKGDDVNIHIENSFDATRALRLSFVYKGFTFGRITQVHMGKPAHELLGTQDQINEWYENAIKTIQNMKDLTLDKADLIEIAKIAFKTRGINDISSVQGIDYNQSNLLDFVTDLIDGLRYGGFSRKTAKGVKDIIGVKRESLMVLLNYKIWKYLSDNNPELYI